MKKASLLLLITMYAVSTFGIGISEFYCCGKLISIHLSFIQEAKEKAAKGETGTGNCCKTTHKFFKIKDNHKAANNSFNVSLPFIHLRNIASIFNTPVYFKEPITAAFQAHAPPLEAAVPIYVSNCVFRI